MEKLNLFLIILLVIAVAIILLTIALYLQVTFPNPRIPQQILIGVLVAVGTTLLTAMLFAVSIEWYSAKKLEKLFKKWEKHAATATLAALSGIDIPEDLAESLKWALREVKYISRNYVRTFRFYHQNDGSLICNMSIHFEMHNIHETDINVPCQCGFLRGFLPDLGRSLCVNAFRICAPDGELIQEATNLRPRRQAERLIFQLPVSIPRNGYRVIDITATFRIPTSFFCTFVAFNTPVKGIRISIETDMPNACIGIKRCSALSFDDLHEESRTDKALTVTYGGVAFAGQALALWIYNRDREVDELAHESELDLRNDLKIK